MIKYVVLLFLVFVFDMGVDIFIRGVLYIL